jgi:hypothetical protein
MWHDIGRSFPHPVRGHSEIVSQDNANDCQVGRVRPGVHNGYTSHSLIVVFDNQDITSINTSPVNVTEVVMAQVQSLLKEVLMGVNDAMMDH